MKKLICFLLACLLVLGGLCQAETSPVQASLITVVDGDGQKPWLLVLNYGTELAQGSVDIEDYVVENYDIEAVYTSDIPELPEASVDGCYVIIELSRNYTNPGYTTSSNGGPGGEGGDRSGERPSGTPEGFEGGGMSGGGPSGGFVTSLSNQLTVTWQQISEITAVDGTVFAPSESGTTDYEQNTNLLVDSFQQLTFTCADGTELMYNLFVPADYDEATQYPLMLFMPDATGEGNDPILTLTESKGAVIWTTEESQSAVPCIVLAPQYVEANSENPEYTMELLEAVIAEYSVHTNRLYLSGQSSGTIRAIKLMTDHPDTFAAALLVAGQADSAYEDKLAALAGQNIWMICSAGDERAYPGMTAIEDAVNEAGTEVEQSQWSARLTQAEQNALAEEMAAQGATINWTVFDAGTVMRDDTPVSAVTEHMNTWRVAFDVDAIRSWVLSRVKEA